MELNDLIKLAQDRKEVMYVLTRSRHNYNEPKWIEIEKAAKEDKHGMGFRLDRVYNPRGFSDEPILSLKRNVFALTYWWARLKIDNLHMIKTAPGRRDTTDMELAFSHLKLAGIQEVFVLHDMESCEHYGFLNETDAVIGMALLAEGGYV